MKRYVFLLLTGLALVSWNVRDENDDKKKKEEKEFPSEIVDFRPYDGNPVFKATGDTATWDEQIRERGFILKEDIIKLQHNCSATRYWNAQEKDFLLIMHEHLFVFRKPSLGEKLSEYKDSLIVK